VVHIKRMSKAKSPHMIEMMISVGEHRAWRSEGVELV